MIWYSGEGVLSTVFKKIIDREVPADIVFEDDLCIAFKDIHPVAPVHILLIPKKEIPTLQDVQVNDRTLMGYMVSKIPEIAKSLGIDEKGYRVIVNCKEHGGQEVPHLHFHIIGGRQLSSFT